MEAPPAGGGGYLTIQDIVDDNWVLEGLNPDDLLSELGGIPNGYTITTLVKGTHAGQGWALRELGGNGEYGDVLIRWHPGGGRHGPDPYWRVSSGPSGKGDQIPAGQWDPQSTDGGDGQPNQPPGEICEESFSSVAGCGDPSGDLVGGEGDDPAGDIFGEFFASLFGINPCADQHAAYT